MPKIKKIDESAYRVESHEKGKFYDVNITSKSCTCPHYRFRMARERGECKHITSVKEFIIAGIELKPYKRKYSAKKGKRGAKPSGKKHDITLDILKEVELRKEIESAELIERYGELIITDLLDKGYIIESNGKMMLMR